MNWFARKISFDAPEPSRQDYLSALAKLQALEGVSSRHAQFQISIGWCYYSLGELRKGARHFETALQLEEFSSTAMHALAWTYEKSGFDKSVFQFPDNVKWHNAIRGMGDNSLEFSNIAIGFAIVKEFKIAIYYFNKSLAENPKNNGVYPLLAFAYRDAGQFEHARRFYDLAIERFPDDQRLVQDRNALPR